MTPIQKRAFPAMTYSKPATFGSRLFKNGPEIPDHLFKNVHIQPTPIKKRPSPNAPSIQKWPS
jgi:hypothetical protein